MTLPSSGGVNAKLLRTTFILNPVSGRASWRAQRRARLEEFLRRHQLAAELLVTERRGHATELALGAVRGGAELVVSVGGDGTMNEVAAGIVGTPVLYGMIPTGSGNGLGRDLGLPMDFERALAVLLAGAVRTIDSGTVDGHPFFNVMGVGFDAELGRRFNETPDHNRGLFNYVKLGWRAFFSFRKESITIEPEGGAPIVVQAFLASVANSSQYGNNARIAPRARLDDRQLDFVAVTTSNPILALPLLVRLFTRTIHRSRYTQGAVAARFHFRRAAPGPVHTDGEIHLCPAEFDVIVRPHSLRVVVPLAVPAPS